LCVVEINFIGGGDVLHDPTVLGCRIGVAQSALTALGVWIS
jgi:hypothetical protein